MAMMRTSITMEDDLLEQATRIAEELEISRSRVIAIAMREFIERRRNSRTLDALNKAYADELDSDEQQFLRAATISLGRIAEA